MFAIASRRNYPRETWKPSEAPAWRQLSESIAVLAMPLVVVGSVVLGIATATESAAIGVALALVIGVLVTGAGSLKDAPQSLRTAALMSARIMIIIAFSQLFVWILILERVPEQIAHVVASLELGPVMVLLLINVIVLALGTFVDVSPAILLLTPTLLPAAQAAGVAPRQFGIVLISGLAVGACTPPVGTCLNVGAAISRLPVGQVFAGAAPFLLANLLTLLAISIFPSLVLWIPSLWMS